MGAALDMSQIPLPNAVEELDYATVREESLERYAELMEVTVDDLSDNDPAVRVLEVLAYRETLLRARINDSVRRTLLASSFGAGLDDLGADPLYDTDRLVIDEGDESAVPPVAPTYESDPAYKARLQLAPAALSVAGPSSAYQVKAKSAHVDAVDVHVDSPDPCVVLIQVLHDSEDDVITAVNAAVNAEAIRPVGDRVSTMAAEMEPTTFAVTVYVPDGPDLAAVEEAAQARVEEIVYPLAAKVGSGEKLSEGASEENPYPFLGACFVAGVRSWEVTSVTGATMPNAAWWPMTITVTAVRSNA